jgi:hypothetical protein
VPSAGVSTCEPLFILPDEVFPDEALCALQLGTQRAMQALLREPYRRCRPTNGEICQGEARRLYTKQG